ncbi:uncharacterized protein F4812DRAFT_6675 [Daldinia caldariorum]|uniref:uncharacterized protein n=1 Tax=Daldinia caldariorum TaxID=326644 RepID=UPI0020079796|nr:uncharacterized protein F4812DRAFT_6675 [Daldinia caldariorum]KAI1472272.1 hypothetical protein F4812DRAFT_6675 [Daldinia caldariorum]
MSSRRRPTIRQTEASELAESVEPVARQTQRGTRRPEAPVEPESRLQVETSRRGPGRLRGGSPQSAVTNEALTNDANFELENPDMSLVPGRVVPQDDAILEVDESLEMDAARIEDMLDFDIPKLSRRSDSMYDVLSSIDGNQPSAEDLSMLKATRRGYNQARLPFADVSSFLIRPINIPEDFDLGVRAKVQVAICSGNIISLLSSIIDVMVGEKDPLTILEQLDNSFPVSFDPYSQKNGDTEQLLDLAFRIRFRHVVELLAGKSSADPRELATGVFYIQSSDASNASQELTDQGQYKPLAGIDINGNHHIFESYRARIEEILSMLFSDDRSEVESRLDQDCPKEELFRDLRSWGLDTYRQLHVPADQKKPRAAKTGQEEDTYKVSGRGESESLFVENNEEAREDSDPESDTDATEYDQLPTQESNQNFIDSYATLAAVRKSENQHILRSVSARPSNEDAVEENSEILDVGDAIRHLDPSRVIGRPRKRPAPGEDGEDGGDGGDDDDFEVNVHLLDESRRPRNEYTAVRRPPFKRLRISEPSEVAHYGQGTRERSGSDISEELSLQGRDLLRLSQEAQHIRRGTYAPRPRQIRVPWSASDTSQLLDLIADPSINCSWSTIARLGNFEHPRNQQQVRDKARSLKVLYLECDKVLPPGFDKVVLGQKEKAAVIKCYRNPDRREYDMDEEGITNNMWVD